MDYFTKLNTYVSFKVDDEYYAANVAKVLEVIRNPKFTRIPNTSDDIRGIINFRGEIITVFDTRTRFGLPRQEAESLYVVIIFEIKINDTKLIVGAVCDKVKDVIKIENKQIMDVPKMKNESLAELVTGIYKKDDNYIMILDIDKMFTDDDLETIKGIEVEQEV